MHNSDNIRSKSQEHVVRRYALVLGTKGKCSYTDAGATVYVSFAGSSNRKVLQKCNMHCGNFHLYRVLLITPVTICMYNCYQNMLRFFAQEIPALPLSKWL